MAAKVLTRWAMIGLGTTLWLKVLGVLKAVGLATSQPSESEVSKAVQAGLAGLVTVLAVLYDVWQHRDTPERKSDGKEA